MRVTTTNKKFTISLLTDSDLVTMYYDSSNSSLRDKIRQVLTESISDEAVLEEYGCTVEEYWSRVLDN